MIVHLLSEEGQQLRAVVKGVRKTRSRFGARMEPFSVVNLLLHTGRSLDVVREAESVATHAALREDLDLTTAAAVVVDVLDKVSFAGDRQPVLFQLGVKTLDVMEQTASSRLPILVAGFLIKAMSMIGLKPCLGSCTRCGGSECVAIFAPESGGVICEACAKEESIRMRMSTEAWHALAALVSQRMEEIALSEIDSTVQLECLELMRAFVTLHVPGKLGSLRFLSDMRASGAWPQIDPPQGVG